MKLNARHIRFAEAYVAGATAAEAMAAAGGNRTERGAEVQGSRWLNTPEIAAKIKELQDEAAERNAVTVDWIVEKLKHQAETAQKPGDRIRALEILGKYKGMFTDRVEHSGPNGAPLTIETIRRVIVDPTDKE
jgi:phage terminase small subunit